MLFGEKSVTVHKLSSFYPLFFLICVRFVLIDVVQRSRDRSSTKKSETFTQTDDIKEPMDLANDSEVKSKNDLQEIEVDLVSRARNLDV